MELITKRFRTSDNEEIEYYYSDNGKENLVLIHGNISSLIQWDEVIEIYEKDYNILCPSMRGYGESTYNQKVDTLISLAEDIRELIDSLKMQEVNIIAWSMGGGVGMELAYLLGNRAKKLVLSASMSVFGYPMYKMKEYKVFDKTKPLKTKKDIENSHFYIAQSKMINEKRVDIMEKAIKNMFKKSIPSKRIVANFLYSMPKQRNLLDVSWAILKYNITKDEKNPASFEGTNHIKGIKSKILMLYGTKDDIVVPEQIEWNKKHFEDKARTVYIEGAGHGLHMDDLYTWEKEVTKFLKAPIK